MCRIVRTCRQGCVRCQRRTACSYRVPNHVTCGTVIVQVGNRRHVDFAEDLFKLRQRRCRCFGDGHLYHRAVNAFAVVADLCSIVRTRSQGCIRCQRRTASSCCVPNHVTRSTIRIQVGNRRHVNFAEHLFKFRQCRCRCFGDDYFHCCAVNAFAVIADLSSVIRARSQRIGICQWRTAGSRRVPNHIARGTVRVQVGNRSHVDLAKRLLKVRQVRCRCFRDGYRHFRTVNAFAVVADLGGVIRARRQGSVVGKSRAASSRCVPNHVTRSAIRIQVGDCRHVNLAERLLKLRQRRCRCFGNDYRHFRAVNAFAVVADLGGVIRARSQRIGIYQWRTAGSRCVPNHIARGTVRVQVGNRRHVDFAEYLLKLGQRGRRCFSDGYHHLRAVNALAVVAHLGSVVRACGQCRIGCKRRTAGSSTVPNHVTRGTVRIQVGNRRHIDFTEYLLKLGQRRRRGFGNRYLHCCTVNALAVVAHLGSVVRACSQCRIGCKRCATCRCRIPNHVTRGAVRIQVGNRRHIDFAEYLLQFGQYRRERLINGNRYRC